MKKGLKVIQINGFRGLLLFAFVVCCLITGFVEFPAWVCMHLWNFVSVFVSGMPEMEMLHGILLWAIIALSIYATRKSKISIGFASAPSLSESDMDILSERIRKIEAQSKDESENIKK